MTPRLLDGIRVIEAATFVAGPTAGLVLADMGADVIRVENPTTRPGRRASRSGDPVARANSYDNLARNKRSIALNLQMEQGLQILYKLVAHSDVFITNFSSEQSQRLKIDYPTLKSHNRMLVYGRLSAWGSKGPRRNSRGFDYLLQGASGLMWSTGNANDEEPSRVVGGVVDTAAGTLLAMGILGALVAKERQGIGQELETSLLGSAIYLQRNPGVDGVLKGTPSKRNKRMSSSVMLCYYRCADGKWLNLCEVQFQLYWPQLAAALEVEVAVQDRWTPNAPEFMHYLDGMFARRTRDEWLAIFDGLKCEFGYAPVNTLDEAVDDVQVQANGYVLETEHPRFGRVRTPGFPVQFQGTPSDLHRAPPTLGEQTDEILAEFCDISPEEVERLRADGTVT